MWQGGSDCWALYWQSSRENRRGRAQLSRVNQSCQPSDSSVYADHLYLVSHDEPGEAELRPEPVHPGRGEEGGVVRVHPQSRQVQQSHSHVQSLCKNNM